MSNIKLFESQQIRSVWNEGEQKWYFSVIDVVAALTDSPNPRDYWYRIKQREKISGIELSTICRQFKLEAPDGKLRETDCSHAEGWWRGGWPRTARPRKEIRQARRQHRKLQSAARSRGAQAAKKQGNLIDGQST